MGYGDLDIESLGVKKAVISCSDGDVKIKDSALNSLEMEMELGDLHLKNTSVTNSQITLDKSREHCISGQKQNHMQSGRHQA